MSIVSKPQLAVGRYEANVNQIIPSGVFTDMVYQRICVQTSRFVNLAEDPAEMSLPTAGLYRIIASCRWETGPRDRSIRIIINNTVVVGSNLHPASVSLDTCQQCESTLELKAGDNVKVQVFQNSGSDKNLLADDPNFQENWCYLERVVI